jgi:hypothetical protein
LLMRRTQGVIGTVRAANRKRPHRAAGACYVDDPCFAIRGTPADRRRTQLRILCTWLILRFSLSWHKASVGRSIVWTGFLFIVTREYVDVEIPEDKVQDLKTITEELAGTIRELAARRPELRGQMHEYLMFLGRIVGSDCVGIGIVSRWCGSVGKDR